jgi:hypothetical protein
LVDDGHATGTDRATFRVLTISEGLEELCESISNASIDRYNSRPFLASCEAAHSSFARGNTRAGINQLKALREKLNSRYNQTTEHAENWNRLIDCIITAAQSVR